METEGRRRKRKWEDFIHAENKFCEDNGENIRIEAVYSLNDQLHLSEKSWKMKNIVSIIEGLERNNLQEHELKFQQNTIKVCYLDQWVH